MRQKKKKEKKRGWPYGNVFHCGPNKHTHTQNQKECGGKNMHTKKKKNERARMKVPLWYYITWCTDTLHAVYDVLVFVRNVYVCEIVLCMQGFALHRFFFRILIWPATLAALQMALKLQLERPQLRIEWHYRLHPYFHRWARSERAKMWEICNPTFQAPQKKNTPFIHTLFRDSGNENTSSITESVCEERKKSKWK